MFSAVFNEVTGILDRRFLMTAFFPSLIFWGLLIVLMVSMQENLFQAAQRWDEQESFFKTLQIIGFFAWVTFFANMVSSQLPAILRFYEGRWNFPFGGYFQNIGKNRHRKYLEEIKDDDSRYGEIYHNYPLPTQPEQVMPTRLGNILKNAELYPQKRYKIDAVLIWPRLYHLLPERFIQTFAEARSALDFMLVISSLSGAFVMVGGGYLIFTKAPLGITIFCILGGLFISWMAYKSAISNGLLYAQQIKVAFDLYRNELIKQMHLPLPANPDEEKKLWHEIVQFLYRNVRENPKLWTYMDANSSMPLKKEDM
jgi:hypothetical protein